MTASDQVQHGRQRVQWSGTFFGLASGCSLGVMALLVHVGRDVMPATQLVFVRGALGLIMIAPMITRPKQPLFHPGSWGLWTRSVLGPISIASVFWNLQHTSVGTAGVLAVMGFALLPFTAWHMNTERMPRLAYVGCGVVVVGLLVLSMPAASRPSTAVLIVGLVGAVASALSSAAHRSAARHFSAPIVVAGLSIGMMTLTPLAALAGAGAPWVWPTSVGAWTLLIGVAGTAALGQVALTRANRHLPASAAVALSRSSLLWAVGLTAALLGSLPTIYEGISCVVVFGGLVLIARSLSAKPAESELLERTTSDTGRTDRSKRSCEQSAGPERKASSTFHLRVHA
jgi:drug/metabolite transporter (DMT)-like permease